MAVHFGCISSTAPFSPGQFVFGLYPFNFVWGGVVDHLFTRDQPLLVIPSLTPAIDLLLVHLLLITFYLVL